MNRTSAILLLFATLATPGCSSISGHRVINAANGENVHGLPIVVQRPRYLKVTYKQVQRGFLLTSTSSSGGGKPPAAPGAGGAAGDGPVASTSKSMDQRIEPAGSSIEVTFDTIDVGEVYAIDLKRPFSGTADLGIEFEPGKQYPKEVRSKVDDNTLKTASDAIGNILDKVLKGTGTEGNAPPAANEVILSSSIIRIEVYDLDNMREPIHVIDLREGSGPRQQVTPSEAHGTQAK